MTLSEVVRVVRGRPGRSAVSGALLAAIAVVGPVIGAAPSVAAGDGVTALAPGAELVRPGPAPGTQHSYSLTTSRSFWSGVAVRPVNSDYDLIVYDDAALTTVLDASNGGGASDYVDYVLVDSNTGRRAPGDDYYPQAVHFRGDGPYAVEFAEPGVSLGGVQAFDFGADDVLTVADSYQSAGEAMHYRVTASGDLDIDVRLHESTASDAASHVQAPSDRVAVSDSAPAGGEEAFVHTAAATSFLGLAIVSKGGVGTATVYRDSSAPELDLVLADGSSQTSSREVPLDIAAADVQTGVQDMRISVDGTLDTEPFRTVESTVDVSLPSGAGTKTVLVQVRNNAGMLTTASRSIELHTVPGRPTIHDVVTDEFDPGEVVVSFDRGAANGAPIQSSTVQCVSTDGGATRGTTAYDSEQVSVPALTLGKTYRCRVRSTNAVGTGPYSSYSQPVTLASPTAPEPPFLVSQTPSAGAVSVAFVPVVSPRAAPTTGFTAQCVSTNGGVTSAVSGAGSPLLVDGLTANRNYRCRVRATNEVGTSAYSPYGAVIAVPAGVPGPVDVTASRRTSGAAASVTFRAGRTGGTPITAYTAQCVSTDGGPTRVVSGTASPLTVPGLAVGKAYRCRVRATNAQGTGAFGAYGTSLPGATVPAAPSVSSVTPGPGSLTVAFSPGSDGGDPITSYTVTCAGIIVGDLVATASGKASPITVTGLPVGSYFCGVQAVNAVGASQSGYHPPVQLPHSAPPPVTTTAVTRTADPAALVVEFRDNGNGGVAIDSYTAQCVSTDGGTTRSASLAAGAITVSGLSPGKTYRCRVRATNAVGTGAYGAYSSTVPLT